MLNGTMFCAYSDRNNTTRLRIDSEAVLGEKRTVNEPDNSGRNGAQRNGIFTSNPRQHQFRPQPADRRGAQGQAAAIESREIDHDREPEPRSRL
jgi:hypothetical protein